MKPSSEINSFKKYETTGFYVMKAQEYAETLGLSKIFEATTRDYNPKFKYLNIRKRHYRKIDHLLFRNPYSHRYFNTYYFKITEHKKTSKLLNKSENFYSLKTLDLITANHENEEIIAQIVLSRNGWSFSFDDVKEEFYEMLDSKIFPNSSLSIIENHLKNTSESLRKLSASKENKND